MGTIALLEAIRSLQPKTRLFHASSSLIFGDPAQNLTGGAATSGEALIYTSGGYSSGTPTLSGNLWANGLTKVGTGNLLLSGTAFVSGTLAVQQGILTLAGSNTLVPQTTALVLNDTGTLDLAGQSLAFASLANSTNAAGGYLTN